MFNRIAKSSLLRASSVYTFTNIINAAVPFALLPILTRFLTPSEYGLLMMFQVLIGAAAPFVGLNTYGALSRLYLEQDNFDLPEFISNCFIILIASTLLVGLAFWIFSGQISQATHLPGKWLWAVLAIAASQFIIQITLTLWQMQKKAITYAIFQITQTLLNLGLSIVLVLSLGLGWQGRIEAQVLAITLFAILAALFLWQGKWMRGGFNGAYFRQALKFGVPLIPHTVGTWIIFSTDRILINNMIGIAEAGIYSVGIQIGMIIGILQNSFNQAWVPWLFERLKRNDPREMTNIVKITYAYDIIILLLAFSLAAAAPWFLKFLAGKDFADASQFVLWISLGFAFNGMYKMVTNYIFYANKTHQLALLTFSTAIINLVASYILINLNGAIGAAQGTALAYFISFILTWFLANRIYRMPWKLSWG